MFVLDDESPFAPISADEAHREICGGCEACEPHACAECHEPCDPEEKFCSDGCDRQWHRDAYGDYRCDLGRDGEGA